MTRLSILVLLMMLFMVSELKAQIEDERVENPYFIEFSDMVTSRLYLTRSQSYLSITEEREDKSILYWPNSNFNLGIGATYKWLTLNLAYGFIFLNPDRGQGRTRFLDLQSTVLTKKFIIDLYGQFYKGFHLITEESQLLTEDTYYVRPDIVINKIGASARYVFNHERYSLRSLYVQNEWQQRSAGSFLVGFEFFVGRIGADSNMVPAILPIDQPMSALDRVHFLEFNPNLGYAYNLVIRKNYFVALSATLSPGFGYSLLDGADTNKQWGFNPNISLSGFAGFNSEHWALILSYTNMAVRVVSDARFTPMVFTDNLRLNLIYRFVPGKNLSRILRYIQDPEE